MTSELILGEAGARGGYYEFKTSVTAGSAFEVHCGFKPTQIMITQISNSGAYSNSIWMFLYDKDYSPTKCRYAGYYSAGSIYTSWQNMDIPPASTSSSAITEITNDGFKWHQNVNYDTNDFRIIAIRQ